MKSSAVVATAAALAAVPLAAAGVLHKRADDSCRCLPGDACWPSTDLWNALNTTVGGKLIATVPIGSVCHDPNYDEAACNALKESWTLPETHFPSSSSVMQSFFANQSCDPFTDRTTPCLIGNYVNYVVEVTSAQDVVETVNFARENNIRFLVRNTGHDHLGRSTGAGALAAWTHKLKDISVTEWSDDLWTGPAMKMGAGVLGYEITEAGKSADLVVVGGECPTVGPAGGYIQGGGHSALTTNFGMAADQTLEFEVVTADGKIVTASRTENADLFWALSGGGPGTFGVVTSVTVRAYPDANIGGVGLQTAVTYTTPEKWWQMLDAFHSLLPGMTDQGAMVVFLYSSSIFAINPLTAYNKTAEEAKAILQPFLDVLAELAIPYSSAATNYSSYRDHYDKWMGPLPYGHVEVESYNFGSRLVPRSVLSDTTSRAAYVDAIRYGADKYGVLSAGVALNATAPSGVDNAVNPHWRNAAIHVQYSTAWSNDPADWEQMIADQKTMTEDIIPPIEAATPGSGNYVNEADFNIPDWKEKFFGGNYDRLLEIKKKWDASGLFYALKTVGSDAWNVAADGRMCRV
ncbi:FAD binding domain-containing protein (isoamyl alcohol oxidase) [Colletotrichum plurivorum]|uniref:FAD binding domain-containing protein (Isoamyl alcohol oxidase) n=1 Tax=Colletotrichum plurivorum TaxID=2175906 RepID=A0A8H6NGM2_9PEZI|nr:FAD binding domain-containing protein (isoamyl alcohol oxidase) [Colletotrichum plurivorum]